MIKPSAKFESMASALYDGGWRKRDKKQLKNEYELSDEETTQIVERLEVWERQQKGKAK